MDNLCTKYSKEGLNFSQVLLNGLLVVSLYICVNRKNKHGDSDDMSIISGFKNTRSFGIVSVSLILNIISLSLSKCFL